MTTSSRFVATLLLAGPAWGQAPGPVQVAGGQLAGTVAPSGVREFRGIPFAASPVGKLRWKPPQPVVSWHGVRDATRFGPRCMQLPVFSDMVFRSNGVSEDCLYLNVWAPAPTARPVAVLLYFYGGGYIAGDGSELRYDGESLARQGIVVVTANYRLGVFGFLAYPELSGESPRGASGDYGLLDQAAALQWVRDNIAAFGGDPGRVTVAGESAGSTSVTALVVSPLTRTLIAGAIGESGALLRPTIPPVPLDQGELKGLAFARRIGASSLAELRAIPADSLLRATAPTGGGGFPITIDGYFLPRAPADILAGGEQAHVPLLVGWNTEESNWRVLLGSQEPTPTNYAAIVHRIFGGQAEEALRLFPGDTPEHVMESGTRLAGARFTAFSTWKWAELQRRTGSPVYRYLYAHPRPPPKVPGATSPPTGAVHSADIEYFLGNLATNEVYPWTPEDYRLSTVMESYVANFVTTGDPNGADLPPWPAMGSSDTTQIMLLDVRSHAEPAPHQDAFRFLATFYATEREP